MASPVPVKSQPLHNFTLPHLKWKNHRSGRNRVTGDTSSSSSPPNRSPSTPHLHQSSPYLSRRPSPLLKQSPMRDSESESEINGVVPIGNSSRKTAFENSTKATKSTKLTKPIDNNNRKRSNKICIKFRNNGNVKHDGTMVSEPENQSLTPEQTAVPSSAAEEEESTPKMWNLRPRRTPMNHKQSTGLPKIGSSPLPENRYFHGNNNSNKDVSEVRSNDRLNLMTSMKRKFSISLSREEIEEDIFSLTGSKPSRRPKKRPRTVQKQLDTLFPGLWLGSITADSYKVSEAPSKLS